MSSHIYGFLKKQGEQKRIIKTSLPLLCLGLLFLIYLIKKIAIIHQSPQLLLLLDTVEWPLYFLAFFNSLYKAKYTLKEVIVIGSISIVFGITYIISGYAELLKGALLIVAMRKTRYEKIINIMLYVLTASALLTLFLFIMGLSDAGQQRRGASSIGYAQANTVGFVLMLFTYLEILRKKELSFKKRIGLLLINIVGYLVSDSRAGLLMAGSAIVLVNKKNISLIKTKKIPLFILFYMPVICYGLTMITASLYPMSRTIQMLDRGFSSRIWLNYYNISTYDLTIFGQKIQLWNMKDVIYNPVTQSWSNYMTVDNVYVGMILQMGILSVLVVFFAYRFLIKKLFLMKDYTSIIILTLLCVYGLVESSVLSVYVCFPFLTLLHDERKNIEIVMKKRHYRED